MMKQKPVGRMIANSSFENKIERFGDLEEGLAEGNENAKKIIRAWNYYEEDEEFQELLSELIEKCNVPPMSEYALAQEEE